MLKRFSGDTANSPDMTDAQVVEIISQELPHWKLACDPGAPNPVILTQREFGRTLNDIFLMHAAILYAGIMGKTVTINP